VITGYALALTDVGEPDPGEGPEVAASHFLTWLAKTERPWLVVLDDLTAAATLEGLRPAGAQGRVVVTTPRADTAVQALNRRVVEVGVFSAREALAFLSTKLPADPDQWIGAVDLATELGFLPIRYARPEQWPTPGWTAANTGSGFPSASSAWPTPRMPTLPSLPLPGHWLARWPNNSLLPISRAPRSPCSRCWIRTAFPARF
jgi:hypothetical protein